MSDGGAQRQTYVVPAYPSYKLRAFDAGTSDVATIWSDEAKTTAITQPLVADANGVATFFGDNDYKFTIHDSGDVLRYTWDSTKLTSDTGTMWQGNFGTALPSAVANAKGHMFAVIDGSNNFRSLNINESTSWLEILSFDTNGNQTFGSVITKTMPVYNVQHADWGAVPGQASDQSSAIQAAIDAIEAAGSGVLYFPQGVYQVDSSLDINNTNIKILGDGSNLSILKQTSNPSAPLIDYDTNDVTDKFHIEGISIATTVVNSNTGLDCFWPSTSTELDLNNLVIKDVYIGPDAGSSGSAYFASCLIMSDAKKAAITDLFIRGVDNDSTKGNGIRFNGYTFGPDLKGFRAHYLDIGMVIADNSSIVACDATSEFLRVGDCVAFALSSSTNDFLFTGTSFLSANDSCVSINSGSAPQNVNLTGCILEKASSSTVSWKGVLGDYNNLIITGCTFYDVGSTSGTDICISLDTTNTATISGNTFRDFDNSGSQAVALTANTQSIHVTSNIEVNVDSVISDAGGTNNIFENNFSGRGWPVVVSDATITVPPVGDNIELSGTTAITTINGGWVGRQIKLYSSTRAASTLQIQTGGNLKLAANHTIENNNNSTLTYDGSNWIENSYTTAA
jgi:hypothetical protein